MARYQVPQFIEVEDKIFGPLTFRQFVYLAGGAGACFLLWRFLPNFIALFLIIPVAAFAVALAFYKMNGKPFIEVTEAAFKYVLGHKLYIWKKEEKKKMAEKKPEEVSQMLSVPKLSDSKLEELSWSLDINDKLDN